jgi:hypothetical protein
MRSKDLVKGAEVGLVRGALTKSSRANRAVVLSTSPWVTAYRRWRTAQPAEWPAELDRPDGAGDWTDQHPIPHDGWKRTGVYAERRTVGVLVYMPEYRLVSVEPLSGIKGLYADVVAEVARLREASDARYAAEANRLGQLQRRFQVARDRIGDYAGSIYYTAGKRDEGRVIMPLSTFERLTGDKEA